MSVSHVRYAMEFPSPSQQPYVQEVYDHEVFLNFSENDPEEVRVKAMKRRGIVSCAGLSSEISSEYIMWLIEYYNLDGKWLKPHSFMRMHLFDIKGLLTPRMVFIPQLVEPGLGSPMHPFLHQLINFFKIAHIQLSPKSYRLEIGIYMMYLNKGYDPPTIEEIAFFVDLQKSGKDFGFFYFSFWPQHNKKGFSTGNSSNMKMWKNEFLYLYDVPRITNQFNLRPRKLPFRYSLD